MARKRWLAIFCGCGAAAWLAFGAWLESARADDRADDAAPALSHRPRPEDLDFFRIKTALSDHVHGLPAEQQAAEKERIRELSNIREYLVKLFKFIPYNTPVGVRLANGRTIKGALWGNEKELVLRPPGGHGKAKPLKWGDVAVEQFPAILEFYAQQRLQRGLSVKESAKEADDSRKKEAAYDYFRAALLADWYDKPKLAVKYAKLAVTSDPGLEVRLETLLPGLFHQPQTDEATPP